VAGYSNQNEWEFLIPIKPMYFSLLQEIVINGAKIAFLAIGKLANKK